MHQNLQDLRLAQRLSAIAPSPMLQLAAMALTLRERGRDIISLATGEPDLDTPEHVQDAAFRAIRAGDTHYTAIDGTKALKEAVRRKFLRENGLQYALDEISVGAGAKQVIFNAFAATVDAGDEVIFAAPFYPAYVEMVRMHDGQVVVVPTERETGFKLSASGLEAAITPRTKWVVLNSPSNPTGSAYTANELTALANVLLRHPHVWILADDIYEHLLFTETHFATIAAIEPGLSARTLTVNGVSKAYCMTGWRIGYGGGPANLIKAMQTVQSQVTSCPSSVSQAAAVAALDGPADVLTQLCDLFRQRRNLVVEALTKIPGLECPKPDGAFYVFPSCTGTFGLKTPDGTTIKTDSDFAGFLLDAVGIVVVPGEVFGVPGHIRLSYAADTHVLSEACRRIDDAVSLLS